MVKYSIVVPAYNEEKSLQLFYNAVTPMMENLQEEYEMIFVNDGSKDKSGEILREFHKERPDIVKIIDFNGNYGQHTAIVAAFERTKGDVVVTLDADLQNPPEEIGKLLQKIDEGCDSVGGYRKQREDTALRRYCSKTVNFARDKMTNIRMKDQGCMLRAYKRKVVEAILKTNERSLFIPALAYTFSLKMVWSL